MRRLVDILVMLAGGFVVGWLLVPADQRPIEPALGKSGTQAQMPEPPMPETVRPPPAEPAKARDCPPPRPRVTPEAAVAEAAPELLAPVYLDIIGPLNARSSRNRGIDAYAAFARDRRDETWAAAMEAGVENWNRARRDKTGPVVEFVECRSKSCIIAGHSPNGSTIELHDMWQSGWWQAAGTTSDWVASYRDGSSDFLIVVERYADAGMDAT